MNPTPDTEGSNPQTTLERAVIALLRPLVRVLVARGIVFPQLIEWLKLLYVEQARELLGPATTQSRLSVATGVHRKDVKRLLSQPADGYEPNRETSLASRALGLWLGADRYQGADGEPLALPLTAPADGGPSFHELVTGISRDVRPRAVLDEWLRRGLVTRLDDERITLDGAELGEDTERLIYYFGRNLRDHVAASSANLEGRADPFFDRAVFYDRLTPRSIARLRAINDEAAQRLLLRLNKEAVALALADEGDPSATERITVGVYLYAEDEGPAADGGGETKS